MPAAKPSTSELQVGDVAPHFTLSDEEGRPVSLADFRGKKVVLYFYPKDDTPGCTLEACDFRDGLPKFRKQDAVILGVSADRVESHKKFKAKYKLNFPLLSDTEHKVLAAYGVWKQKSLYGRTFMGIERTTVVIDEQGRILKIFPKVKVAGHAEEVRQSLKVPIS